MHVMLVWVFRLMQHGIPQHTLSFFSSSYSCPLILNQNVCISMEVELITPTFKLGTFTTVIAFLRTYAINLKACISLKAIAYPALCFNANTSKRSVTTYLEN